MYYIYTYMGYLHKEDKRKWDLAKYHEKRQQRIKELGGKCVLCGSIEKLEFDHKDKNKKNFNLTQYWYLGEKKFRKEFKKCQLLCKNCHLLKTLKERGLRLAKGNHGTVSTYRYCHCNLCKEAKNVCFKKWKESRKRITINGKRIWIKNKSPSDNR